MWRIILISWLRHLSIKVLRNWKNYMNSVIVFVKLNCYLCFERIWTKLVVGCYGIRQSSLVLICKALWSSWRCPCSLWGGWTRWPLKVFSNPKYSMMLWSFYNGVTLVISLKKWSHDITVQGTNFSDFSESYEYTR